MNPQTIRSARTKLDGISADALELLKDKPIASMALQVLKKVKPYRQVEMAELIPRGRRQPLWWALRRPARPLTYHAVHRMFERVNQQAGTSATLHSLRHTAAYRMAEDPALPLTDVQFVLGHAQLTTTQIYLTPRKEDVIRRVLTHHVEQTRRAAERARPALAPGYRPDTLEVLFHGGVS